MVQWLRRYFEEEVCGGGSVLLAQVRTGARCVGAASVPEHGAVAAQIVRVGTCKEVVGCCLLGLEQELGALAVPRCLGMAQWLRMFQGGAGMLLYMAMFQEQHTCASSRTGEGQEHVARSYLAWRCWCQESSIVVSFQSSTVVSLQSSIALSFPSLALCCWCQEAMGY
eukprot:scaffold49826_cov21-Tisochrysis_lutea.AAC.1